MTGFAGPRIIHWAISGKCNLSCEFCYGHFTDEVMSLNDKQNIINKIGIAKIPQITFTGGEPLLEKETISIIEYASGRGIYSSLHTNGIRMDGYARERLSKSLSRVSLALDGVTDEMCYRMRKISGQVSSVLDIVAWAKSMRIPITIKTVASRVNQDELGPMREFLEEVLSYDPRNLWCISQFAPLRGAQIATKRFSLTLEEFDKIKLRIKSNAINILIKSETEIEMFPYFFLDAGGDVLTWDSSKCQDVIIGNLCAESIEACWNKVMAYRNGLF